MSQKQRVFVVSSASYLIEKFKRGGIKASPYVEQKRREIARFRECQQELTETLETRKARSEDRAFANK